MGPAHVKPRRAQDAGTTLHGLRAQGRESSTHQEDDVTVRELKDELNRINDDSKQVQILLFKDQGAAAAHTRRTQPPSVASRNDGLASKDDVEGVTDYADYVGIERSL